MYYILINENDYDCFSQLCIRSKWKSMLCFFYGDEQDNVINNNISAVVQASNKKIIFLLEREKKVIYKEEINIIPYTINTEKYSGTFQLGANMYFLKGMVVRERGLIHLKKGLDIELSKNISGNQVVYALAAKRKLGLEMFQRRYNIETPIKDNLMNMLYEITRK